MKEVIKTLKKFSDANDLWTRTKVAGVKSIFEHFDEINMHHEPVDFIKKHQALIFWNYFEDSFIIRTTYDLKFKSIYADNLKNTYSLDVNEHGQVVDDWLILE